jgi:hypothetical protein
MEQLLLCSQINTVYQDQIQVQSNISLWVENLLPSAPPPSITFPRENSLCKYRTLYCNSIVINLIIRSGG